MFTKDEVDDFKDLEAMDFGVVESMMLVLFFDLHMRKEWEGQKITITG